METTITVAVFPPSGKIVVTFSLLGDTVHDSDTDGQVHTLSKGNLQTWIPETQMVVDSRATVKTVLEAALAANNMSCYNPKGNYVVSVTKGDVTLAEFTNGKNTGWMYTLNGHHPENAVNEQYRLPLYRLLPDRGARAPVADHMELRCILPLEGLRVELRGEKGGSAAHVWHMAYRFSGNSRCSRDTGEILRHLRLSGDQKLRQPAGEDVLK